jgi:hypothetical protein
MDGDPFAAGHVADDGIGWRRLAAAGEVGHPADRSRRPGCRCPPAACSASRRPRAPAPLPAQRWAELRPDCYGSGAG